jgi:hypothetical protein
MRVVTQKPDGEDDKVLNIFADPIWNLINHAAARAHGFYPNLMYHNQPYRLAAIVVTRHADGQGFYLNTPAVGYLLKAMRSDKISNGFVVLRERDVWRVLAFAPISEVWENVRNRAPYRGKHSEYWIVNESFAIAKPALPF